VDVSNVPKCPTFRVKWDICHIHAQTLPILPWQTEISPRPDGGVALSSTAQLLSCSTFLARECERAQTAGLAISSTARLFSCSTVLAREGERVALLAEFGTKNGTVPFVPFVVILLETKSTQTAGSRVRVRVGPSAADHEMRRPVSPRPNEERFSRLDTGKRSSLSRGETGRNRCPLRLLRRARSTSSWEARQPTQCWHVDKSSAGNPPQPAPRFALAARPRPRDSPIPPVPPP